METETQMREIAQKVYDENQTRGQFSTVKIPLHVHNGIDNAKINLGDANFNSKALFTVEADAGGGILVISSGISNPSSILLYGIATDGFQKAHVSGNAQLGTCYTNLDAQGTINPVSNNIVQASSGLFNGGGAGVVVCASGTYLAGIVDGASANIVTINVRSFTNTSITLEAILNTGSAWTFTGYLIVS